MSAERLRMQILELVRRYYDSAWPASGFRPDETPVPVSGRVFDSEDIEHPVDVSLDDGPDPR